MIKRRHGRRSKNPNRPEPPQQEGVRERERERRNRTRVLVLMRRFIIPVAICVVFFLFICFISYMNPSRANPRRTVRNYFEKCKNTRCNITNIRSLSLDDVVVPSSHQMFTILINTWQRNECLAKSIAHHLKCNHSQVAQIRVIWSDSTNDIPDSLKALQETQKRLVFDEYEDGKLTNRFEFNEQWQTSAIFQIDDDQIYSCELILNAFKLWQLFPNHLVGFAPRDPEPAYTVKNVSKIDKKSLFYGSNAYNRCRYSMMFAQKIL